MQLQFRTVQGKVYKLEADPNSTIGEIKQKLEDEHQLPKSNLKIILSANILNDDQVISSLKIPTGAYFIIHVSTNRRIRPTLPDEPPSQAPVAPPPVPDRPIETPPPPPPPPPPQRPPPSGSRPLSGSPDPPNFEELVLNLTEIGFSRPQCEQALRMANYDPERACNLLLTGEIPVQSTPQSNQDTDAPLRSVNFGQFQPVYDSFTPEEKAAVERLLRHADPNTVIQFYMACDKNEEQTLALLT